jgi:hypothetical protein
LISFIVGFLVWLNLPNFQKKIDQMSEIVFDNENAIMTYSKTDFTLELIWKSEVSSEEFRKVYVSGLKFASENKVHNFLSDIRKEGLVSLDDVKWLTNSVISNANQLGIKKIALINEEELIFSSIYAESLKKKIENFSIQVNLFRDLSSARTWLMGKG